MNKNFDALFGRDDDIRILFEKKYINENALRGIR